MTAAAEVAVLIEELMPLMAELWELVPERPAAPATGTMSHHHALTSPAPWHQEAGPVLYTIAEEARRLEASLRREVAGHLGPRRGGSDANTVAALKAITNLVHAVPDAHARKAGRIIAGWIRQARQVRDLALEQRPVRLPTEPGEEQPTCPYCDTYALRVLPQGIDIWCINRGCKDQLGRRPRGRMGRSDLNGDPQILWADGRTTYRRDWV